MAIDYSACSQILDADDLVFLNSREAVSALKYRQIQDYSQFNVFHDELISMDQAQTEELIKLSGE